MSTPKRHVNEEVNLLIARQTQTVIRSLRDRVVDLVQDLNGNHVIQKCLNRLSAEDAQVSNFPPEQSTRYLSRIREKEGILS